MDNAKLLSLLKEARDFLFESYPMEAATKGREKIWISLGERLDAAIAELQNSSKLQMKMGRTYNVFASTKEELKELMSHELAGRNVNLEAAPERKCGTCKRWLKDEDDDANFGQCEW